MNRGTGNKGGKPEVWWVSVGAPRVFSVVASSVAMCIDLAIYTDTL